MKRSKSVNNLQVLDRLMKNNITDIVDAYQQGVKDTEDDSKMYHDGFNAGFKQGVEKGIEEYRKRLRVQLQENMDENPNNINEWCLNNSEVECIAEQSICACDEYKKEIISGMQGENMKITYPYEVEINTKEEAVKFIKSLCNECPRYRSNWDCSGATAVKCQHSVDMVVAEFGKKTNKYNLELAESDEYTVDTSTFD